MDNQTTSKNGTTSDDAINTKMVQNIDGKPRTAQISGKKRRHQVVGQKSGPVERTTPNKSIRRGKKKFVPTWKTTRLMAPKLKIKHSHPKPPVRIPVEIVLTMNVRVKKKE